MNATLCRCVVRVLDPATSGEPCDHCGGGTIEFDDDDHKTLRIVEGLRKVPCAGCGARVRPSPAAVERGWATVCAACTEKGWAP